MLSVDLCDRFSEVHTCENLIMKLLDNKSSWNLHTEPSMDPHRERHFLKCVFIKD